MRRRFAVLLVLAAVAVTACGDSSSSSGSVSVQFVGNSTCDTSGQQRYSPSPPNVNSSPPVGQPVNEMPHVHVAEGTKVTYEHNPPTSGCHYNLGVGIAPITPGVYPANSADKLTAEYWMHNLEHGYIAVTYNCPSGCDADLAALNAWYKKLPPDPAGYVAYAKFIAVPYPAQKEKWAVISWDWYDPMGSALSLTEVQKFYDNHVNQAPESPASG
jgi:hypothetical protein